MPNPGLTSEKLEHVKQLLRRGGMKRDEIAFLAGVGAGTVSKIKSMMETPPVVSDKKIGEFDWREWAEWAKQGQKLKKKASWSQEEATFTLGDGGSPVI